MKGNMSMAWASRRAISMFICITLSGVKILRTKKSMRVIVRKMMMMVEADFEMTVATTFCSAGRVGMGLGVGVVGGGPGQVRRHFR